MGAIRTRQWLAMALLLVLGATLGCARGRIRSRPSAERGVMTVLREQQATWIRNFNPFLADTIARWPSRGGIYEPLIVFNSVKGEYVPWLCTRYAWQDDNRTLTFWLREGVKWSDGAPLVAEDVIHTFEIMRQHRAADLEGAWTYLDHVSSPAPGVVAFHLTEPFVPALSSIGHQPIVPKHIWQAIADPVRFSNPSPVATGPFTEVKVFENQVYELGKNPNYWQPGIPKIQGLRFPAFPSNERANLALVNGEIDWTGAFIPAIDRVFVSKDPQHNHYWFAFISGTVMLYTNTTRPPLGDARVRKAISMAIDRKRISEVAEHNYSRPADATGLSDAYVGWRSERVAAQGGWVQHDPEAAEKLLDEAGFARNSAGLRARPDGSLLEYEVNVVAGWSDWIVAVQIIARDLQKVGITAKLRAYDYGAFFDRLQRGDFDLSLGWTVPGATPYELYRPLMSSRDLKPLGEASPGNWHRFADGRADALFQRFERTSDAQEQHEISEALQALFVELAPALPLILSPTWGQYTDRYFVGFPNADAPYAPLAPFMPPQQLFLLTRIEPRVHPSGGAPVTLSGAN